MSKLKKLSIGYGRVKYYDKKDKVPKTTKVEGNTTINNMGRPEIPARHEVDFFLGATCVANNKEHFNGISVTVLLHDAGPDASYLKIENAAAQLLAPLLREIADDVEKQVQELSKKPKNKS